MDDNTRLALIRTLLAVERNYMAIERTHLSGFRTGITLAVIAPTIATALPFLLSSLHLHIAVTVYILLIVLTIFGLYITIKSYRKLKRAEALQELIRCREREIASETELTKTYFQDIMKYEGL